MDINWETVVTSMISSLITTGGLFAIFIKKDIENHKFKLQNNGKIFDLELISLNELSKIIIDVKREKLENVTTTFTSEVIFLMKLPYIIDDLNKWLVDYSYALPNEIYNQAMTLVSKLEKILDETSSFVESGSSWGMGKYKSYKELDERHTDKLKSRLNSVVLLGNLYHKSIMESAGRKNDTERR